MAAKEWKVALVLAGVCAVACSGKNDEGKMVVEGELDSVSDGTGRGRNAGGDTRTIETVAEDIREVNLAREIQEVSCADCEEGEGVPEVEVCQPNCEGRECGDDGCGGVCGECKPWLECTPEGLCTNICVESCAGRECGPDACGGQCGTCDEGLTCTDAGLCVEECTPDCAGKECGGDGCGGQCGPPCTFGMFCSAEGLCKPIAECVPSCGKGECGPDGCGGECGKCESGQCTVDGKCSNYCSSCLPIDECFTLDFELGNLVGWSVVGDARVVQDFGNTEPEQGEYMGLFSTAKGMVGMMSFENCIPADYVVESVSFRWKLYSEEFLEFCGTVYPDTFHAYLEKADGTTLSLLTVDTCDLCPPESCKGCGSMYTSLEPAEVALDKGDAYATPWLDAKQNVMDFVAPGEIFRIVLKVEDGLDSSFDTLVLVDDIKLDFPCEPQCEGKECGDDGCGGECGSCDDMNECTKDKCDPVWFKCLHFPQEGPCDDGDPSTTNDMCVDGKCVGQ